MIPDWFTEEHHELWAEYVAQRKKDKKEMTPRSMKGRLNRLTELRAAGHDPVQCMEEALNGHWLDFWEPKEKPITRKAHTSVDDYLERRKKEQEAERAVREASQTPEAKEAKERAIARAKSALKVVGA